MAIVAAAQLPAVMHIAQGAGLGLLLTILRTGVTSHSSTAVGNAALCIGELARHRKLLPLLRQQDAVAPLLGTIMPS